MLPQAVAIPQVDLDEAELVRQAKEFMPMAWETIYERYFPRMYTFVYVHTGDRIVAEDIAIQVFEEAWRGIGRYKYRGVPLAAWLYKIAHNLVVDHFKQLKRKKTAPIQYEGLPLAASAKDIERIADRDALTRAMQKLTREQQRVLVHRFVEGLNVAETAAAMGKRETAIRALEFRALRSLRRLMGQFQ